ncbi:DNA cytosine methyltransferase [Delftia sp. WSY_22]|uniref:DNA cytosine methyltransferase n=1 Tax=Delftia sp. WSY_22 TaxID=3367213 RepID=UPI00370C7149
MKIEAIDLFCGAGGLTRGLLDAGIQVKAGFDVEESCRHAYEANNGGAKFFNKDVGTLTSKDLNRLWSRNAIRLLAGCAPCQPFSPAANSVRDKDAPDPRYYLLDEFTRLIKECNPHLVTMENVPKVQSHAPFHKFVKTLTELGYDVWFKSISCENLGIPQTRRRLVLLASRIGDVPRQLKRPTPTTASNTVGEALKDLTPLKAGEADPKDRIHFARSLSPLNIQRIQASKPGGTWRDWPENLRAPCHIKETGATFSAVYARMRADQASPTMTTQFYNFGAGRFGHPTQDRALTPREAAIIQSFPKSYDFVGSADPVHMTKLGKMIGNAVPPKLGEAIGLTLHNHVQSQSNRLFRQGR